MPPKAVLLYLSIRNDRKAKEEGNFTDYFFLKVQLPALAFSRHTSNLYSNERRNYAKKNLRQLTT